MLVLCAWCGKVLKAGSALEGISHGICQWCVKCWFAVVEPVDDPWTLWQDLGGSE